MQAAALTDQTHIMKGMHAEMGDCVIVIGYRPVVYFKIQKFISNINEDDSSYNVHFAGVLRAFYNIIHCKSYLFLVNGPQIIYILACYNRTL